MSENNLKFFAAELGAKIPEIDLHGFYPTEALEKMEMFLYDCQVRGEKMVRIIYGGGKGVLREAVLRCLKAHPLVVEYEEKGGNTVVIL